MKKLFLSQEEQSELVKKSNMGDEQATTLLLQFCYPFIAKFAAQFLKYGCEFEDLVQEGYIGVMYAIPRYRPEFNTKFITYAVPWILKKMRAHSYERHTIHIPVLKIRQVIEYQSILNKIEEGLLDPMTDEEIAILLEVSISELSVIKSLPIAYLKRNPLFETEKEAVRDFDDAIVLKVMLETAISQLSDEEQYAVNRYFHLDGRNDSVTYGDIAKDLNCSPEWVRQILLRAREKLKNILEEYL